MKPDPADPAQVLNMDVLAPEGYGEIVGGSVREDDLAALDAHMKEKGIDPAPLEWYREIRQFGSVPHAGFGLGLERTLAWICGVHHLRETIAFPRLMGRLHP
jgi:asparaginyl-tRNA synthetase